MARYHVVQSVKLEWGRKSALAHHVPDRVVEITQEYVANERYVLTGSAFQRRDPTTNLPATEEREEFSELVYVTFGHHRIEELA